MFRKIKLWLAGKLIKDISRLAIPEPSIIDVDVALIRQNLQNGDCLVSRREYEFSNALEKATIGSYWGHVAIYLNGFVYEDVTKDGFRCVSLERFCLTKDDVGICRVPGSPWTDDQIAAMTNYATRILGTKYDYSMDWLSDNSMYCAEATVKIISIGNPTEESAIKTTHLLGEKQYSPQNIWDSLYQVLQIRRKGKS